MADRWSCITWSTLLPSVIRFKSSQSYFFGYAIVSDPVRALNHQDVRTVAKCLISNEVVPEDNALTYADNSSCDYTATRLAKAFKSQASNVESEGIFIFYYSGPGHDVGQQCWSLASSDFDARDQTTHITAGTITSWLVEAACKAKHVLVILNCSHGGASIAAALTDNTKNSSGLSTCVLSTNGDPPSLFTSLETSATSHFLCAAITKMHVGSGLLKLTNLYNLTAQSCEAFFKLIVSYNPAAKRLDLHDAHPTIAALGKPQVVSIMPTEENDGPPGMMQFLTEYFHDGMKGTPLHYYSYDWLQWAGNVDSSPLADLLQLGVLHDEVVCAVICAMMYTLASVQVAFEPVDVDSSNRLLMAFTAVAATVSTIARDSAELNEQHFRLAWRSYCETVESYGLAVPRIRSLFEGTRDAADLRPAPV